MPQVPRCGRSHTCKPRRAAHELSERGDEHGRVAADRAPVHLLDGTAALQGQTEPVEHRPHQAGSSAGRTLQLIDGIRWRTRTGASWRDVPGRNGL
ncbi:hypothetical protein CEB94_00505 [Streptomyces hawaiiensis]|uniref:Transposase n=1 Tax=Streptomyces hawaiiensis TaxID=67305 RepID=A0A6G5R7G6_9ACTN|nr:hypothetical protein CEB94_00505 [Streptomyces hawaiiensis]